MKYKPSKGRVGFKGEDIAGLLPYKISRRGLARSLQITNIFPGMTVYANVRNAVLSKKKIRFALGRLDRREGIHDEVMELITTLGLDPISDVLASELSYGRQRALEVGIGLATDPSLIFLDEPTAGGALGRPIKLIQYDNQMKPDIAVRMAMKAIMEDGAKVIMNHTSSAVGLALSKAARELNVIHVTLHNEADEIMGSEFQLNSFRLCLSASMHSGILANNFATTPYKRFYLINMDHAFGHAVADSFRKMFQKVKRADQEIVGDDYHPMTTKDFGAYVTKALAAKPDVVITGNFGPDLPGLIKHARALGMKAVFGSYYLDNSVYMNQIRDSGTGSVTFELYMATIKTKKNQAFVTSWQGWFKKRYPDRAAF